MDTELINKLYKNKSYIEWKRKDDDKSLWEILGKSTNEMCHSRFIKYLFSCESDPSTSKFAFIQFLRLLVITNDKSNYHNEVLDKIRDIVFLNCDLSVKSVLTEVTDKNNNSRYDIIFNVELNNIPINVVIENKVMSSEDINQTDKYYANFKNMKDTILVYLSIKKYQV